MSALAEDLPKPLPRLAYWPMLVMAYLAAALFLIVGVILYAVLVIAFIVTICVFRGSLKRNQYHRGETDRTFWRLADGRTLNFAFRPKTHYGRGGGVWSTWARRQKMHDMPWPWALGRSFDIIHLVHDRFDAR